MLFRSALMSLMAVFGIPFAALLNFFAREVSVFVADDNLGGVKRLHSVGLIRVSLFLGLFLIIPVVLSPMLGRFLGVSIAKIMLVLVSIYVSGLVVVNTGVIQGLQAFRSLSLVSCWMSVLKFTYAVFFVWIGWGVYGAVGGLLATSVTLLVVSQWLLTRLLPVEGSPVDMPLKRILKYAGGLFLANACFSVLTQADVMLVRHYFSAHEAGLYSSAAVMGKAVMYLPGAIVMALFPMAAANEAAGRSSAVLLIKAVSVALLLSGSGALLLYLFPEVIMGVLFGDRYLEAARLTAIFGLTMLPMALLLLLMNYLLAQGWVRCVWFLGLSVAVDVAGISLFRDSLENILYVIMVSGIVALLPMVAVILAQGLRAKRRVVVS